jgi:hypothetical protein
VNIARLQKPRNSSPFLEPEYSLPSGTYGGEDISSYWTTLRKRKKKKYILEMERESTRSHVVEKSLWKRRRTE